MKISWFDSPSEIDAALETAERARAAGLHRYWNPQVANADPMVTLAIVGREVPDIGLGTSVVAHRPRDIFASFHRALYPSVIARVSLFPLLPNAAQSENSPAHLRDRRS